ncbi:hypothetical protein [Brachybacterium sp. GPGPB12]|uniref:hypothetical protein n=1 Tax=Brachybacterium sp. GPGPB12 TaxID=3023517 RepID=UPI0031345172
MEMNALNPEFGATTIGADSTLLETAPPQREEVSERCNDRGFGRFVPVHLQYQVAIDEGVRLGDCVARDPQVTDDPRALDIGEDQLLSRL